MKHYPSNKPTAWGYYMVQYNNPDGNTYYKAIAWNNDKQIWVAWNSVYEPEVLAFWEETRSDYYTECLEKKIN